MPDPFVSDCVGSRVSLVMVNEAGTWYGTLLEVGEQWIKVLVGRGKTMMIPITNIRSMAVEEEGGDRNTDRYRPPLSEER